MTCFWWQPTHNITINTIRLPLKESCLKIDVRKCSNSCWLPFGNSSEIRVLWKQENPSADIPSVGLGVPCGAAYKRFFSSSWSLACGRGRNLTQLVPSVFFAQVLLFQPSAAPRVLWHEFPEPINFDAFRMRNARDTRSSDHLHNVIQARTRRSGASETATKKHLPKSARRGRQPEKQAKLPPKAFPEQIGFANEMLIRTSISSRDSKHASAWRSPARGKAILQQTRNCRENDSRRLRMMT